MKYLFVIIVVTTFFSNAKAQHVQDSLWVIDNYQKIEVYVGMRDSTKLFTAIYLPKDTTEKHPILLARTPYSCAPYGEKNFLAGLWTHHFKYYARENYILVFQDVRGKWKSEGVFQEIRPFNPKKKNQTDTDEATDAFDTIEWLIQNLNNNNGNVGVFGTSYPGFYATMAAMSGHPALKAASPQAPVIDWFMGDDVHHNGAFFLLDAFSFFIQAGMGYPQKGMRIEPPSLPIAKQDSYATFLQLGALRNIHQLTGDSSAIWRDIYDHPDFDSWWQARSVSNFANQINVPALIVGGLFDAQNLYGPLTLYNAIEKESDGNTPNYIVLGPWYHGQWSSSSGGEKIGDIHFGAHTGFWFQNNIELPFFNYYLKGKGEQSAFSKAIIFFTGDNRWRKFSVWPLPEIRNTPLYFYDSGKLSFEKPTSKDKSTAYVSNPFKPVPYSAGIHFSPQKEYMLEDQRFASRRPDVITFQTAPLEKDLTLAGKITVMLDVQITSTDADFIVKVIDVFPDDYASGLMNETDLSGYQMLIRGDVIRGKYRKSFKDPMPFTPGKVEPVKFSLLDVAHTFKKGHRIMVQIQSSWFPLVDRNPQQFVNIYTCGDDAFIPSTIRLHHNSQHASHIILPILDQN